MGYTIYWQIGNNIPKAKLEKIQKEVQKHFGNEIKKLGLDNIKPEKKDEFFHESFSGEMLGNDRFGFCKTARKKYDKAVKSALIKAQKLSGNAWNVHCDDGCVYTKEGVVFDGSGLYEWAKPKKPVKFQLDDLPIEYETKGDQSHPSCKAKIGEYDWVNYPERKPMQKQKQFVVKKVGWDNENQYINLVLLSKKERNGIGTEIRKPVKVIAKDRKEVAITHIQFQEYVNDKGVCVLGSRLAAKLGVKKGDKVVIDRLVTESEFTNYKQSLNPMDALRGIIG